MCSVFQALANGSEAHDLSLGQVGLYFTDVGKSYYDKADLQMGMMELATAAEFKCGVTWVVMNNQCLGWPQYHQVLLGQPTVETNFEVSPDFVKLAESQGCNGIRVTDPEQVESALTEALRADEKGRPVLVDCHIARHDYPKQFAAVQTSGNRSH